MPASNRYKNWSSTSFATTAIDGVRHVDFDGNITAIQEGADVDAGPTICIVTFQNPTFTVHSYNCGVLLSANPGTPGVFTTTMNDARNGSTAGGGAKVFTTNALSYIGGRTINGDFNQLSMQNLTFHTCWADGVTNPVSVTSP